MIVAALTDVVAAVTVEVTLRGAGQLQLQVPGDQPLSALDALVQQQLSASGESAAKYSGLQSVSFLDSPDSDVDELSAALAEECSGSTPAAQASTGARDAYSMDSEVGDAEALHICGASPWHSSLWNGPPLTDLRALRVSHMHINKPWQPVDRRVATLKFENVMRDAFDGLQAYRSHGNDRLYLPVSAFSCRHVCCD